MSDLRDIELINTEVELKRELEEKKPPPREATEEDAAGVYCTGTPVHNEQTVMLSEVNAASVYGYTRVWIKTFLGCRLILILNLLLSIDVDSVKFFLDLIDIGASRILNSIDSQSIVALPEQH
jgi:hypothetical protein